MNDLSKSKYLSCFNNFIKQLKVIFPNELILNDFEILNEEDKISKGTNFNLSIKDEHFDSFLNCKIKIFSHKNPDTLLISQSLFGENFCLKNLLNNQANEIKNIIWIKLHSLYLVSEQLKPIDNQDKYKIKELTKQIYKGYATSPDGMFKVNAKEKIKEILDIDFNAETSNMFDDIINSFEDIMNNNSGNPFSSIMNISQQIASKYTDKINSGDIELDKIIKSIGKKIPGVEQLISCLKSKNEKPKETIVIDDNFSTSIVNIGTDTNTNDNLNIGNILKMADNLCKSIPSNNDSNTNTNTNTDTNIGSMPMFNKIIDLLKKIDKVNTTDGIDSLKTELDNVLQSELGMSMNNFQQISKKKYKKKILKKPKLNIKLINDNTDNDENIIDNDDDDENIIENDENIIEN
jgi:hypothetical protein